MNFKPELSGNTTILRLDGELTIERVAELKTMLAKSLERADHVHIQLEAVTEADISCLQLFCSAHRTALSLNKNLTLNCKESEVFRQVVEHSGYSRQKGCTLNSSECCLWIGRK